MRKTIISWILLFACNLIWSLQFTSIKLVQEQVGHYFTVWGPMLMATIFLVIILLHLICYKYLFEILIKLIYNMK